MFENVKCEERPGNHREDQRQSLTPELENDDALTLYVYEKFTASKPLNEQVDEILELANDAPLKATAWGKRKHQYWSHRERAFLYK